MIHNCKRSDLDVSVDESENIGNLFYSNTFGKRKEQIPLKIGRFYFHIKPIHKYYEKLNQNNNLVCIEGKGKVNKNSKITLFF